MLYHRRGLQCPTIKFTNFSLEPLFADIHRIVTMLLLVDDIVDENSLLKWSHHTLFIKMHGCVNCNLVLINNSIKVQMLLCKSWGFTVRQQKLCLKVKNEIESFGLLSNYIPEYLQDGELWNSLLIQEWVMFCFVWWSIGVYAFKSYSELF